MFTLKRIPAAVALALALTAGSAHAVLERTGPTDPANGFPAWYQDNTGLSLELCLPQNQAETEGGHCLLLPGDPPLVPEVFPGAFFDEHFWWSASANLTPVNGGLATLVLALEAAFAADVAPGGQMTFTRIRVRLNNVPVSGTYRFIHPYGEESIEAAAGERIFFTDDVGITCTPGEFSCAMEGRVGPFLLPSVEPGGAEEPPVAGPVAGKLYIADPGRLGPVTGSPLPPFQGSDGLMHNHNIFRIEGPPGSALGGPGVDYIETGAFSLMGRIHTGQMPSLVTTNRATYARTPTEQKVDVYATAFRTASSRLPGSPRPAGVAPVTSFYDVACGLVLDPQGKVTGYVAPTDNNAVETLMVAQDNSRWGQIVMAPGGRLPDSVCVKDNSAVDIQGRPVPAYHQLPVNDEVKVTEALYDQATETLTVQASSSDTVRQPKLTVAGYNVRLENGVARVIDVFAPPSRVQVVSEARGVGEGLVQAAIGDTARPADRVVAGNDAATTTEDVAVTIPVIIGDTLNGTQIDPAAIPVTLAIIVNGGKGVAVPDNATGRITYTPNANANGADSFTYTVTAAGVTSNVATVKVDIAPVNDAPTANADQAAGAVNTPILISVLANDSDPDGDVLTIAPGSVTAPVGPLGTTSTATANANGTVTFNASGVGTYRFSYQATDGTATSETAVVTVTVSGQESLTGITAEYVASKGRWKVGGTTSIATAHGLTLKFAGPCNAEGRVIGTTTSSSTTFAFDVLNATGPLDPRTTNCTAVRVESALGGVAPSTTFRLK